MEVTAAAIENALAELVDLPTPVKEWRVETGPDVTEDPAVWAWVRLEEDDVDFETRSRLRDLVRRRVRDETDDASWVYVRFRGASEPI